MAVVIIRTILMNQVGNYHGMTDFTLCNDLCVVVTKRFIRRKKAASVISKAIAYLPHVQGFRNPHQPNLRQGQKVDMGGNIYNLTVSDHAYGNIAAINHYHTKSYEEYLTKIERGRATMRRDNPNFHRDISFFDERDFNDVVDTWAWDDFNNRLTIVQDIFASPYTIQRRLLTACNGSHICDISAAAHNSGHKRLEYHSHFHRKMKRKSNKSCTKDNSTAIISRRF
jgi:hypothetical protein